MSDRRKLAGSCGAFSASTSSSTNSSTPSRCAGRRRNSSNRSRRTMNWMSDRSPRPRMQSIKRSGAARVAASVGRAASCRRAVNSRNGVPDQSSNSTTTSRLRRAELFRLRRSGKGTTTPDSRGRGAVVWSSTRRCNSGSNDDCRNADLSAPGSPNSKARRELRNSATSRRASWASGRLSGSQSVGAVIKA